jgi:hypothetical protein
LLIPCGLTTDQLAQFHLFGFVVLRNWLTDGETDALRREVEQRLRAGWGEQLDERPWMSGMAGHYVPLIDPSAPLTCALIEDPRFHAAARELLDGECLVSPADTHGVLYYDMAGWHTDVGYDLKVVKFATYFDPLTAATGALRVIPLSHRPVHDRLRAYLHHPRVDVEDVPAYICETQPGDVVVFDGKLFHASVNGGDRLQWSVVYVRDVTEHRTTDVNRVALGEWFEEGPTWDGDSYPAGTTWLSPEWYHDDDPSPVKRRWLTRFAQLGVVPTAGTARPHDQRDR